MSPDPTLSPRDVVMIGRCGCGYDRRSSVVMIGGCRSVVMIGGCSSVVMIGGCRSVVMIGGCSSVVMIGGCGNGHVR